MIPPPVVVAFTSNFSLASQSNSGSLMRVRIEGVEVVHDEIRDAVIRFQHYRLNDSNDDL